MTEAAEIIEAILDVGEWHVERIGPRFSVVECRVPTDLLDRLTAWSRHDSDDEPEEADHDEPETSIFGFRGN